MKLKLLDIHQKENTIVSAVGVLCRNVYPDVFLFLKPQGGGSNQNDSTNIYLVVEPTNLKKNMRLSNWISSPGRGENKKWLKTTTYKVGPTSYK